MKELEQENNAMYEMVLVEPESWVSQARLLKYSAELHLDRLKEMWDPSSRSELDSVDRNFEKMANMMSYMMMAGCAIENTIKGLIVSNLPKPRKSSDIKGTDFYTHDLLKLVKLVPHDLELNDAETELLTRLTEYVIWAGRYPLPTRKNDYHTAVTNKKLTLTTGLDSDMIDRLFFRLASLISSEHD